MSEHELARLYLRDHYGGGASANEMRLYDRGDLRDFLSSIQDRVEPDPEADTVQLCYRIRSVVE